MKLDNIGKITISLGKTFDRQTKPDKLEQYLLSINPSTLKRSPKCSTVSGAASLEEKQNRNQLQKWQSVLNEIIEVPSSWNSHLIG